MRRKEVPNTFGKGTITYGIGPKGTAVLILSRDIVNHDGDGSLLESGLFADAEVHCAGHTWKVHRAILCSRNKWFKAAFAGTFKESVDRAVVIEETDKDEVDLLLKFIYTGRIFMKEYVQGKDNLISFFKIWKVADFFREELLANLVERYLLNFTWRMMLQYSRCITEEAREQGASNKSQLDAMWGMDPNPQFFEARFLYESLRYVYLSDSGCVFDEFKSSLMCVALCVGPILGKHQEFRGLIQDIPEFAQEWMLKTTESQAKRSPLMCFEYSVGYDLTQSRKNAVSCKDCSRKFITGSRTLRPCLNVIRYVKTCEFEFLCLDCLPIPSLEEWDKI